ncbi:unnamed protein product [Soboliphyme baturini]|uniref:Protein kinase domain-containing protein n=1 Tax=Soboliphyme baturini TaxID=241478 RepID=A0A183ILX7_9BILA|nr:unnamed protein product [Soboliphyme baturini]
MKSSHNCPPDGSFAQPHKLAPNFEWLLLQTVMQDLTYIDEMSRRVEDNGIDSEEQYFKEGVNSIKMVKNTEKLGSGGYGQVYKALDLVKCQMVAIKIESKDGASSMMVLEGNVLRRFQDSRHCPRFIACGHFGNRIFIVMQLLGSSLSNLRRLQPGHKFTIGTTARVAVEAIEAIRDLHAIGYVHRDVKPSNFAIGYDSYKCRTLYLLDFGMSRRYKEKNGSHRPQREMVGFRGTVRYASLTTHEKMDLGRKDDLTSLFYVLFEMIAGHLPWRYAKEKSEVATLKLMCSPPILCESLPPQFLSYVAHLSALK